jgi:hypothetical protein
MAIVDGLKVVRRCREADGMGRFRLPVPFSLGRTYSTKGICTGK